MDPGKRYTPPMMFLSSFPRGSLKVLKEMSFKRFEKTEECSRLISSYHACLGVEYAQTIARLKDALTMVANANDEANPERLGASSKCNEFAT
eukprot:3854143-Prymnesium_polylepis.1